MTLGQFIRQARFTVAVAMFHVKRAIRRDIRCAQYSGKVTRK